MKNVILVRKIVIFLLVFSIIVPWPVLAQILPDEASNQADLAEVSQENKDNNESSDLSIQNDAFFAEKVQETDKSAAENDNLGLETEEEIKKAEAADSVRDSEASKDDLPTAPQAVDSVSEKESIETDSASGALTFNYAFSLPAGRSGLTPSLSLNYNSQRKNNENIFGFGWDTGSGYIERINKEGYEKMYEAKNFRASFAGGNGELVPLSENLYGEYGLKVEGGFSKYEFKADNTWEVTDTLGVKYYFGNDVSARLADSEDSTRIARWYLQEVQDTNNNFIKFYYYKDTANNFIYPKEIKYTGHYNGGITEVAGPFSVRFEPFYSGPVSVREDQFKSYNLGFSTQISYRADKIEIYAESEKIREYNINYELSLYTNRSLIDSIIETNYQSGAPEVMPATSFVYSNTEEGQAAKDWEAKRWAYPSGGRGPRFSNSTFGRYDPWIDQVGKAVDLNNDGFIDLGKLVIDSEYKKYEVLPGIPYEQINLFWLRDIDNDNDYDLLRAHNTSGQRETYLNTNSGFQETSDWELPAGIYFYRDTTSQTIDLGVRIIDFNNNGYPDILHYFNSNREGNDRKSYLNN